METLLSWILGLMEEEDDDDDYPDEVVIRGYGLTGAQTTLEISWACVVVGCEEPDKDSDWDMQSFRVTAATCMLRTLEKIEQTDKKRQWELPSQLHWAYSKQDGKHTLDPQLLEALILSDK